VSTPEPSPAGRRRPRIALTDFAGLTHQAQDIGVGISQVLPVVVAAQDAAASVVCIEQPELHVHPAVQVGLGDLFIDGALNKGLSFLIETHSEHLILRLLRRIREAADHGDAEATSERPLTPDALGVNYLCKEGSRVTVTLLPVNTEGDFDKPWPRGFFEERGPELF
jgi:predicted ATPase